MIAKIKIISMFTISIVWLLLNLLPIINEAVSQQYQLSPVYNPPAQDISGNRTGGVRCYNSVNHGGKNSIVVLPKEVFAT